MFTYATRYKLRFPYKGSATVEDLWDLSVQELDGIYKTLNALNKQEKEESLLQVKSKENEVLAVKIDIVKYIVKVKLTEAEQAKKALKNKREREKILAIMANKQDEELQNMSMDELQKKLDELEG